MGKHLFYAVLALFICAFLAVSANTLLAQNENANGNGNGNAAGEPNLVQTQTQNQGEDTQIQTETQLQDQTGNQNVNGEQNQNMNLIQALNTNQAQIQTQTRAQDALGEAVRQMNQVGNMIATQAKTQTQSRIQEMVSAQVKAQTQVQEESKKLENRSGLVKFLIGPNYGAIENMEQHLVQNQIRIQEMQELMNQVTNETELTALQEAIQIMEQENVALQNSLQENDHGFSLLGWLFRWFS